ncbi:MAG: hypothetical protein C0425_05105 [Chlorobiaceae bacterium]|nr:hypothetical protein [Chlorobiaceae bacterium]MBA4309695.1 hypothetical protein [Chlorobiaceae bacterium]
MIFVSFSCKEDVTSVLEPNKPPSTNVAIFPDSVISKQQSKLMLNWWGDDPDGLVTGYFITYGTQKWTFTQRNDSVIAFPMAGNDTTYIFKVVAVDNFGNGIYDERVFRNGIDFGAEPFTDKNGNGKYDGGESFIDLGDVDPTPATLTLPLRNSPPIVNYLTDSRSIRIEIPDTTFTVASFGWTATDIDGDESIVDIFIALNDTSTKIRLPGNTKFVTFRALPGTGTVSCDVFVGTTINQPIAIKLPNLKLNAGNVFYIFARDLAGANSKVLRFPSDVNKTFYVKKPKGDLLIIDDFRPSDLSANFYNRILDSLNFRDKYDILDIKVGNPAGLLMPRFISPMFTETLKLFKAVFWYTDNSPNLEAAQISVRPYVASGGQVLFSMLFPSFFDARGLSDFLPLDSIGVPVNDGFFPFGTRVPAVAQGYPTLATDMNFNNPVSLVRRYFPNPVQSVRLYELDMAGRPIVGFKSIDNRIVFMGIPLSYSNAAPSNVKQFFSKVLIDEFGLTP